MDEDELYNAAAKDLRAPFSLVRWVAENGKLPVVNFSAGGIATPADAALMMQLGAEGVFVGSGIFKSADPASRAVAIVRATTNYNDPAVLAEVSVGLGDAMEGIEAAKMTARAEDPVPRLTASPPRRQASCGQRYDGRVTAPRRHPVARLSPARGRSGRGAARRACSPCRATFASTAPCSRASVRRPPRCACRPISTASRRSSYPGGESTTIGKLMRHFGLVAPIKARARGGMPIYGTCAGLITLAREIAEGDQPVLGLIDIVARRNAFGRQVHSFEADLDDARCAERRRCAPSSYARRGSSSAGPVVEILASHQGHAVAAREGRVLVTAFHPELTGDTRMHDAFLSMVRAARNEAGATGVRAVAPAEEVVS